MSETRPAPPHGRYRRGLEGADFSLEANTENVPNDGRYYVLQNGKTLLATEDFDEATQLYHKYCKEFWKERLEHPVTQVRVSAAWGLLGLDSGDKNAQAIIQRDGSAQERKRLEQAQSRRRALRARTPTEAPAAVTAPPAEKAEAEDEEGGDEE